MLNTIKIQEQDGSEYREVSLNSEPVISFGPFRLLPLRRIPSRRRYTSPPGQQSFGHSDRFDRETRRTHRQERAYEPGLAQYGRGSC